MQQDYSCDKSSFMQRDQAKFNVTKHPCDEASYMCRDKFYTMKLSCDASILMQRD